MEDLNPYHPSDSISSPDTTGASTLRSFVRSVFWTLILTTPLFLLPLLFMSLIVLTLPEKGPRFVHRVRILDIRYAYPLVGSLIFVWVYYCGWLVRSNWRPLSSDRSKTMAAERNDGLDVDRVEKD